MADFSAGANPANEIGSSKGIKGMERAPRSARYSLCNNIHPYIGPDAVSATIDNCGWITTEHATTITVRVASVVRLDIVDRDHDHLFNSFVERDHG